MTIYAQKLLVDSSCGIYCWDSLGKRYSLYTANGDVYEYTGQFHPDKTDWCEEIDYAAPLFILDDGGVLWRVEQTEHGDIWAINPSAEYNEEMNEYFI